MTFPNGALFNKTSDECRRVGARGGRASAISRRMGLATWPASIPDEIEVDAETAHEASVLLDDLFPHLKNAFGTPQHKGWRAKGGRHSRCDHRFILLDGRRVILADAARTLGISAVALHYRMVNRTGGKDYDGADVRAVGADQVKARRGPVLPH